MKILLITDMPPSRSYTGGIVLDQLCRFLPKGSIACFAVLEKGLNPIISNDLRWIPIEYYKRPREAWGKLPYKASNFISLAGEIYNNIFLINDIVQKATKFGHGFGATVLWSILEGQTVIRITLPIAHKLSIPLLTEVWDPPYWYFRDHGVDSFTTSKLLKQFEKTLIRSKACATASGAMAKEYSKRYGIRTVAFKPSLDLNMALSPAKEPFSKSKDLIIGFAGQLYATDCWNQLIKSLKLANWGIAGRRIKIRLVGRYFNIQADNQMNIEFLGWRSQQETIKFMSECDILYCPYWFDKKFKIEASLSFPSKLTTFLAAGRPIFFHGPKYSTPNRFLKDNNAGYCCNSLNTDDIKNGLSELITNKEMYSCLTKNGRVAFEKHLTLDSLRENFFRFLKFGE